MKLDHVTSGYKTTGYSPEKSKETGEFWNLVENAGQDREVTKEKYPAEQRTATDYQEMLSEHIQFIRDKLQLGETEEKFPIGGEEMTVSQWDGLLEGFDAMQAELIEGMRERHQKQFMKQEKVEEIRELLLEEEYKEKEYQEILNDRLWEKEEMKIDKLFEEGHLG